MKLFKCLQKIFTMFKALYRRLILNIIAILLEYLEISSILQVPYTHILHYRAAFIIIL
jgi:hypothetical protein